MFDPQEKKSRIEKIQKALYSRDSKIVGERERHELSSLNEDVPSEWVENDEDVRRIKLPFSKILWGAIIFFILATSIAIFQIFFGNNMISGDNIEVVMSGPVSISGGEELSLELQIQNKNNVDLEMVDLHVEYPDGTREVGDITKELKRYDELIGDMKAGDIKSKIIKAILFGEENSREEIKITVEYRIQGSNAIFYKEKTYDILISSSPVNIVIKNTSEINANQPANFEIEISSNSNSIISSLIMKAEYPSGFEFKSASPSPSLDKNIWDIGDLAPGAKRTIKIVGLLQGQDGEERVFRFTVGTQDSRDDRSISTPFVYAAPSITIKKPFIGIGLALDGNTASEYVAQSGASIRGDIIWENNLATQVYDLSIELKLRGAILNKNSIVAENGFYRSADNTIIFNSAESDMFDVLAPGEGGGASFTFASFSSLSKTGSSFSNPEIYIDISVKGKRSEGSSVPEEILYSDSKVVKISSDVSLITKGMYYIGAFKNYGPIPPKAEEETSYTIIWTVSNPLNDVSFALVKSKLPSYVKWLGQISPGTEKISYNPIGGEINWNIGDIKAGAGSSMPVKEVSFQVSIVPSLSQVGISPILIGETSVSAIDTFTNTEVVDTRPAITTGVQNDPSISGEDGSVVE